MEQFIYSGGKTNQISFPIGGIGTGCIGLAGNGRLIDWEIFNRPNKGSVNGFSHFAIRAEAEYSIKDIRILNGEMHPPFEGDMKAPKYSSGWGPRREYMTGMPHFKSVDFRGEFPIAELIFKDDTFPGSVKLMAFNPFIPTNDENSSIPAAFFEYSITNTTQEVLTYSIVGVLNNPLPQKNQNNIKKESWGHALHLTSDGFKHGDLKYGDLTLATDASIEDETEISWQQYWFRGTWFDNLEVYWNDLKEPGKLKNRIYKDDGKIIEDQYSGQDAGLLAAHKKIYPGETRKVRFLISWSFPLCENYWSTTKTKNTLSLKTWKNYYSTVWPNSLETAKYALANWRTLYDETMLFKETLFSSTLPTAALDAVSANISILKSPTCLRLEDGTFYGWEGLHLEEGCCEGSCTHVWNYQQALPFLFPSLERSMREADYKYNLLDTGAMPFRLQLPVGSEPWNFRPCCDGQFGGIMKTYRDWKICGDKEWLKGIWPSVKKSLEYAWSPENPDKWDPDQSGVLTGRQHHTLDMELFGPNSWLSGFYLGALKASSEMAEDLGESEDSTKYFEMFERGKKWVDQHLFNGEYFIQKIDLGDRTILESYGTEKDSLRGGSALEAYWNDEHKEIKYQIGQGSSIDQVLPQWHATLYGLGDLYDPVQVKKACSSIYKYNFVPEMGKVYNPCRIYCLNDEAGLVICAWPKDKKKPIIPAPYSQETMNGFEYSAAIHMIQVGLVDEGMKCIEAIRHRYDGERRNPWNEFECGNNYARSMASYALLNAFSGFKFDMSKKYMGFEPIYSEDGFFKCFWSLASGWGEFKMEPDSYSVSVLYGELILKRLSLANINEKQIKDVILVDNSKNYRIVDETLEFENTIMISKGESIQILF